MKILVTGSNGLLGQKLSLLLQKQPDIELIATARGKSAIILPHGQYHSLDITNADQVKDIIGMVGPDVVINTAAMTHVDKCELEKEAAWKANVTAVENIIQACAATRAHLVHVSTDFIFDGSKG